MHYTINGYILANEEAKNGFKAAIIDQSINIGVLDLGGSWLIPENVKHYNDVFSNAIADYTDNQLVAYENSCDLLSDKVKYFVQL